MGLRYDTNSVHLWCLKKKAEIFKTIFSWMDYTIKETLLYLPFN